MTTDLVLFLLLVLCRLEGGGSLVDGSHGRISPIWIRQCTDILVCDKITTRYLSENVYTYSCWTQSGRSKEVLSLEKITVN